MDAGAIWDLIILNPMINILIVLTKVLFNNLGLTIIALTIVIRGITYPLNRKQLLASKKMQELQPKIAELQKKYAKDKQRAAKEQMALFKEAGVSPTGCLLPMLTQMPIWLALYQSIVRVLATGPEQLLTLSRHLYASWNVVFDQIPLPSQFLWFDLGIADVLMILPLLVGISMWVQQKMSTPKTTDPSQAANSTMMLWMMPAMFTFFSLSFPSGLALYWVTSNIISIIMQYMVTGWGPLADTFKFLKKKEVAPSSGIVDTKIVVKKDAEQTTTPNTEKRKQPWMFWK